MAQDYFCINGESAMSLFSSKEQKFAVASMHAYILSASQHFTIWIFTIFSSMYIAPPMSLLSPTIKRRDDVDK
jgi:hypothetical protein